MYKLDLHTHSIASPDGGITAKQYRQVLKTGLLDCVAVTDHNRIDFAQALQAELGHAIIVGEEIMTHEGEIIGLFLHETVPPGLSAKETIALIKSQGGLVYIPHPFETVRKGLSRSTLDAIAEDIDCIEVCNGRAFFQDRGKQAVSWSRMHNIPPVASSDAHGRAGIGKTYTMISELPSQTDFKTVLSTARLVTGRPRMQSLLYPKYHRLRKKFTQAT